MDKAKIVRLWAELGEARPTYEEFERAMTRPVRVNQYAFVDPAEVADWAFRDVNCWAYFRLRHLLCSRRVAKLKAAERRPRYYAAENERRRALAAGRRRVRERTTTNACPTREAILEAWNRRRDSHEAAVRFGSLLEDLECYLDSSLRRDEHGVIVGRNPGIRGWLCDNLPEVFERYTTAMRYKAAAKKLKQVAELADPTPADAVLPRGGVEAPELAVVRARAIWAEVVEGVGPSATALMRRLDALTDPERVEDANMLARWRERYANEITVRTKRRWWRRFVKEAQAEAGKFVGNGRKGKVGKRSG